MATKIWLYFVFVLVLAFGVSAVGNVSIAENSISLSGYPGTINSSGIINVADIGASALSGIVVNATALNGVGGTIPASALMLVPNTLNLNAGESRPVAVVFTVPSDKKAGSYTGTLSAVFSTAHQDTASLTVTVNPVNDFSASSTTPSIVPGLSGKITVTVTNAGNTDLNGMTYSVTQFTSGTNTLAVSGSATGNLNVAYGASQTFDLNFAPSSSQGVGTYTGTVTITHGSVTKTIGLSLSIVPINRQISATTTNAAVVIHRTLLFVMDTDSGVLKLNNTGNYPLSGITISPSNLTGPSIISSSSVSISENNFALNVGSGKDVMITPLVPASTTAGTYTGYLTVSFGGTSPLTVPFTAVIKDASASVSLGTVEYESAERGTNVSKSVTIVNNGDFALTSVTLTTNAPNTWITGTVPSFLDVGGSFQVTVTSTVPTGVSSTGEKIGSLIFSSIELSKSVDIKAKAPSMLEFDNVKVSINDGSYDSVSEGGTVDDDAKPGHVFSVKVKLANLFSDDDDEISDIQVDALFIGAGEDGDDIDGESETFDIDGSDKSEEIELEFDSDIIDWEAATGKLAMELIAEGEDDNGGIHRATFNFSINLEREDSADFLFTRFDVPNTVMCGNTFTIYADVKSIGEKSDDEVIFKLSAPGLGVNFEKTLEMGAYDGEECDALDDEDEEDCTDFSYSETFTVPADAQSGDVSVMAKIYRDNGNKQTDEQTETVKIDCGHSGSSTSSTSSQSTTSSQTTSTKPKTTTSDTTKTTSSDVDVLYTSSSTPSAKPSSATASVSTRITDTTEKKSFTDSNAYLALLSVLSIVAIIGIITLLLFTFTAPKE